MPDMEKEEKHLMFCFMAQRERDKTKYCPFLLFVVVTDPWDKLNGTNIVNVSKGTST